MFTYHNPEIYESVNNPEIYESVRLKESVGPFEYTFVNILPLWRKHFDEFDNFFFDATHDNYPLRVSCQREKDSMEKYSSAGQCAIERATD